MSEPLPPDHGGPLPTERRAEFFAALDVFAMPSRTDSFGIVFLEAWANALPIVAAEAGGVPEVVRHGEAGLGEFRGVFEIMHQSFSSFFSCFREMKLVGVLRFFGMANKDDLRGFGVLLSKAAARRPNAGPLAFSAAGYSVGVTTPKGGTP